MAKKGKKRSNIAIGSSDGDPDEHLEATSSSMQQAGAAWTPDEDDVVTLHFKLMNWNFMDFQVRVPTSTCLFTLKQQLAERHGRIRDLVICKHAFAAVNEMTDDMKTLDEYGISGAPLTSDMPVVVPMFYEFKLLEHDDPLLLHLTKD